MANRVTFIFEAIDRYSAVARKISSLTHKMRRKFQNITISIIRFSRKLKEAGHELVKIGRKMGNVGRELSAKLTLPILAFGVAALVQSSKIEQLGVSFEVMLGSAKKAKDIMGDLVNFAAKTPFQLEGISTATKQLLAFGVKQKDIIPTLTTLGDIAAGTGKPLTEFSLIFGKILAKGKLQGEELMQLAEKGIALQNILAKKFKTTPAAIIAAVSKGQITFKHFRDAMFSLNQEGGKFYKLMEKQSKTLGGLWSTLGDAIKIALAEIGDVLVKELDLKQLLINTVKLIERLTKAFVTFTKNNPRLTKLLLIIVGIVAAIGPLILIIGQLVLVFGALSIAAGFLGTTTLAMVAPILAVVAAVGLLITAGVMLLANWDGVVGGFKLLVDDVAEYWGRKWDTMINKIKSFVLDIRIAFSDIKRTIEEIINDPFGSLKELAFGSGQIDFNSNSTTDINVNMSAPKGVIDSVSSVTSGKPTGLNVGVNMVR